MTKSCNVKWNSVWPKIKWTENRFRLLVLIRMSIYNFRRIFFSHTFGCYRLRCWIVEECCCLIFSLFEVYGVSTVQMHGHDWHSHRREQWKLGGKKRYKYIIRISTYHVIALVVTFLLSLLWFGIVWRALKFSSKVLERCFFILCLSTMGAQCIFVRFLWFSWKHFLRK